MRAALRLALLLLGAWSAGLVLADETLAVSGLDELGDQELIKTILSYYHAEKTHDWQTTYALRGPRFAQVVPYATYARQMEIDATGWDLVGIEGRSASIDDALTNLTLSFQEDLAPNVASRLLGPGLEAVSEGARVQRYSQSELTQWVVEEGQWVALTTGARQHFVFNERMVWD